MPSIIPGYNYDIFISYRQKDNKHDGWVTKFVENLRGELESTFKEEINVYFDINPHDGLLETHDVGESLKEKLKCLVFIPVISRTYCDPKSFAWEHEFKAFVEQASKDQFGLKVRLPNGNITSRVLPVCIHDLDPEDVKQCESVLGGVLRGIEFIYKEPGVNRPLKSNDDEKTNLNKTKYINQINKVANAIKEIISGLKTELVKPGKEKIQRVEPLEEVKTKEIKGIHEKPTRTSKRMLLSGVTILATLIIATVFAYPKIFNKNTLNKLRSSDERISVAVMPFQNLTNDTIWNVWQNGIQENLVTYLSNFSDELSVRQTESINTVIQSKNLTNYASLTPSNAKIISQKLDANVFISGSIQQAGTKLRVNARLIDTKTEEVLKSFEVDGLYKEETIFDITDSLRKRVTEFLIISKLAKEIRREYRYLVSTTFPEAYRYYIYGQEAFSKLDFPAAVKFLSRAVAIDSNFSAAINQLAFAYGNQFLFDSAKKWSLRSYRKRDQMPTQLKIRTNWTYSKFFETPYEGIKYLRQILEIDDQSAGTYANLGWVYNELLQYDKAIPEFEKSLELYKKWDSKPFLVWNYTSLGIAYHKTNQLGKEKRLYKQAEKDFPADPDLISRQAILSLAEGDTVVANRYIGKYISVSKENSSSEAIIISDLGNLYSDAGLLDRAEEYYRQALSLEADNPLVLNRLAWFLIDKDRNINEGIELVDKALEINPDEFYFADTKGWGLYKLGRYNEALELLEKNWESRPIYDHGIYLNLEAARKAVTNLK
jgi:tetratricopeptide (TPR) repeat protein